MTLLLPTLATAPLTLIPSPSRGTWYLGPFPVRAYALCILAGIAVAWWLGTRRYAERGGSPAAMVDITFWAVPFGIVGGRLYHVITSPDAYFGRGGNPLKALAIWEGGLGIWGAIALGALGAYIGARRAGVRFPPVADAVAPGILIAQGIGRLGNWFNQELFGAPTTLPWGLRVSDAVTRAAGYAPGTLFQPTFLYEMLWDFAGAAFLIWAGRRWHLRHGRTFALYVFVYCLGRIWIEYLRIDTAHTILGLRLNIWTAGIVGLVALAIFVWQGRNHAPDPLWRPGREPAPDADGEPEEPDVAADGDGADGEGEAAGASLNGADSEPEDRDVAGDGDGGGEGDEPVPANEPSEPEDAGNDAEVPRPA
jgi:prolipoprotein diacylglyceryl transferase